MEAMDLSCISISSKNNNKLRSIRSFPEASIIPDTKFQYFLLSSHSLYMKSHLIQRKGKIVEGLGICSL